MNQLVALALVAMVGLAPAPRALAQTTPTPAVPVPRVWPAAEPLPPEGLKLAEPMSKHMLFFRMQPRLRLERDGKVLMDSALATGLDQIVAPSPRALQLALDAHHELVTGSALVWTGVGMTLASAIGILAVDATNPPDRITGATDTAFDVGISVCAVAVLTALVLEIVGFVHTTAGMRNEFDAVNAYNADLVDGQLVPPAVPAR